MGNDENIKCSCPMLILFSDIGSLVCVYQCVLISRHERVDYVTRQVVYVFGIRGSVQGEVYV